jgi:PAS domain S-box-containing protein
MPTLNTELEKQPATVETLQAENDELRIQLREAEETISAIRTGAVDALVVEEPAGHRVYTLEGADRPYRLFVEEMQQGAVTLQADGTIAWCNRQLVELLKIPQEKLVGAALHDFISPDSRAVYDNLLWQGKTHSGRGEANLVRAGGGLVSVYLTFNALPKDCGAAIGVLITDQTSLRHHEQLTAAHAALRESERHFREMIDALPLAIYTTDAEGRLTHFNPAAVEFSGHTPQLGTDQWCVSFKLYHPDGRPMPHDECPMAIALKEGRVIRGAEAIAERPNGTRVWFTPYPTPLRDRAGNIVGGINMLLDITERKHAEEARARVAAIVDSSDDAIISKTLEGIITSWNAAAERLLGYRAEEIVGRSVTTVIPPDRQDEETQILERLRREERVEHFETVRMAKDGRRLEASLSISPIRDGTGRVIGASTIMRDITERKRAEEALRAAQAQLADRAVQLEQAVAERTGELTETNKQLEAFVYSIAHDLRAPLRSMEGFSAMLVEEAGSALSETGQEFAKRISRSAQFMDTLLQELLAFSRTAQQRIELTNVNLEAVVHSALSRLEKEIQEKKARVELVGPWPVVLAHELTLDQVIFNLVSNALKFVAPGRAPVVRVRVQEWAMVASLSSEKKGEHLSGSWVRVWVEDNGIGVAPEHQEQIFRLFTRLHGDIYDGTGVGLAIVQKATERMGGQVGVESSQSQGSRFWFELRKA